MKRGDLVEIFSLPWQKSFGLGIYLGKTTRWNDWYAIKRVGENDIKHYSTTHWSLKVLNGS